MVAIGVTFIILMGSIDLSMEGNVSVSAVIFAFAFIALGGTLASWAWLAIPLALVVGAVIGFINGLIHVRLQIPSFMASLAMGFVGTGFALLLTGGFSLLAAVWYLGYVQRRIDREAAFIHIVGQVTAKEITAQKVAREEEEVTARSQIAAQKALVRPQGG